MFRKLAVAPALMIAMFAFETPACAQGGVRVGTLTCSVAGGWGFVFGSSKAIRCTLAPGGGRPEHYAGSINKFGVDIGPTASLAPGALSGNYVGATGSATVGVGAGANVLVGGSNRTISLQPVSIEGNTGLNVAAGIGAMSLRYQPQTARRPRA